MNIEIRKELPSENYEVENLVREAFLECLSTGLCRASNFTSFSSASQLSRKIIKSPFTGWKTSRADYVQ